MMKRLIHLFVELSTNYASPASKKPATTSNPKPKWIGQWHFQKISQSWLKAP